MKTRCWEQVELSFSSERTYANPYLDVSLAVRMTDPDGTTGSVPAFWDGGTCWRIRFAPPTPGVWNWETMTEGEADPGLSGKSGSFEVLPAGGDTPLSQHGFVQATPDGRGFTHADGTPFFWLGDTVWAAPSRATEQEWATYAEIRAQQGFTVAQVNLLPQYDQSGDTFRMPFEPGEVVWDLDRIRPDYFQQVDRQVALSAKHGLVTAGVVLWFDYVPGSNPTWGTPRRVDFTPGRAAALGRYLAARYAAFGLVWLVSGDTDLESPYACSVYDAAARAIQENSPFPALLTAHMHGGLATPAWLNGRAWLGFHMFQSSHNRESHHKAVDHARADRALAPRRPVLNGEPLYEDIAYYCTTERASRADVRKVAWFSLLGGGSAGITYGAHGLWSWHRAGEVFKPEPFWLRPKDWREALELPGAGDFARMRDILGRYRWWTMEPLDAVTCEGGDAEAVAAVLDDGETVLLYVWGKGRVRLGLDGMNACRVTACDPAGGAAVDVSHRVLAEGLQVDWDGLADVLVVVER